MAVQDDAISALRTIVFEYNGREGNRYGKEAVIEAIDALASYNTDLRKCLDRSVSFISGHGSIAGTTRAPL